MGIHNHSPEALNPNPPALCFVLSPQKRTVVTLTTVSPRSTKRPRGQPRAALGFQHELWTIHAMHDLGFMFNPLSFSHEKFQFRARATRSPWPCTAASPSGGESAWGQAAAVCLKCHFQDLFLQIHTGGMFDNGGPSLTTGRRESVICNRLLKLSDGNGEVEGRLTGMSFPDNLCISFIHAMNLLIKSEFQELIM